MEENLQIAPLIRYIYIHIPFCVRKCGYCSFYSKKYFPAKLEEYVISLLQEIDQQQHNFTIKPKTIYFGGGTPSLLDVSQIERIISAFDTKECDEITLECNPINLDQNYVKELRRSAVSRISLGAQSFIDQELEILGRLHDTKKIYSAYKLLREADFENISLDLIYGLPNQKQKELEFSLEEIIDLEPEHISTYCLSLKKDVPLFRKEHLLPNDEEVSKFYYLIRKRLMDAGYQQYEISNFSKEKYESKHNLCYWSDEHYLGFGSAASSYYERKGKVYRCTNSEDIEDWNSKTVELSLKQAEQEFIFLGLRKTKGICLTEYKQKFMKEIEFEYKNVLEKYCDYLILENGYLRLAPKSYFISDEIFSEFM